MHDKFTVLQYCRGFYAFLFQCELKSWIIFICLRQLFFFWFIWFPVAYWVVGASAALVGLPMAIFKKKGTRAVWESPDRGFQ